MATPAPPHLTPSALFEDQARLDALRLATYNRILSAVHQKIKFTSQQRATSQMCFFDVPEWQPGCPRYDVKDCILYIVWNLRHAGFNVIYMPYNRLVINWRDQSIKYYQEDSPIRQAMVAAAETAAAAATARVPPPPTNGKAEKKKASAYKPPTADGVAGMLAQGSRRAGGGTITFI